MDGLTPKYNNPWVLGTSKDFIRYGNNTTIDFEVLDHTSDTDTGAVMVVNAGDVRAPIYTRSVKLQPNTSYRLTYYIYIVNSSSEIYTLVRDGINYASMVDVNNSATYLFKQVNNFSSSNVNGVWTKVEYDFKTLDNCVQPGQNYEIMLYNNDINPQNNDYYIDDISLTQISTAGTQLSSCATLGKSITGNVNITGAASPSAERANYYVSLIDDKGDVYMTVAVDPITGAFSFEDVMNMTYKVVIHQDPDGENIATLKSAHVFDEPTQDPLYTVTSNTAVAGNNNPIQINLKMDEALPVKLIRFDSKLISSNTISSTWMVDAAKDFSHFVLEHSTNSNTWNEIAKIQYTNGLSNYEFNHVDITASTNYYRLKMVDVDLSIAYSTINNVNLVNSQPLVLLYPNPVVDLLKVSTNQDILSVRFFNVLGVEVLSTSLKSIDVSNLPQGNYIVNIVLKDGTTIRRNLIKK